MRWVIAMVMEPSKKWRFCFDTHVVIPLAE